MKSIKIALIVSAMAWAQASAMSYAPGFAVEIYRHAPDDEKTKFRKNIDLKVDALNKKVTELKRGMKKTGKKADADFKTESKKLKITKENLKKKLKAIGTKSGTDWDNFKKDVEAETEKFQDAVESFINKHKN